MQKPMLIIPAVAAAVVATVVHVAPATASPPSDVFLTGTVQTASATVLNGAAKPGTLSNTAPGKGAKVTLTFLDTLHAQVGDEITPQILASTRADSSGRYTLRLKPSASLIAKAAENGGYLNADLNVSVGGQGEQEGVSGYWNGHGWGNPNRPETAPARNHVITLATDPVTKQSTGTREISPGVATGTVYCSYIVSSRPTAYTKVGELHSTLRTTSKWTYGTSADSDIDVGLDYDGNGGWGVHGSARVGTSLGSSTGGISSGVLAGYYATSNFEYVQGYYKPYGTYSGYTTCDGLSVTPWTKRIGVSRWLGGASKNGSLSQYDCYDAPQSSYRNTQGAGTFFATSNARAQKYSASAVFSFISLGATSGFSSYVDLRFDWNKGYSGYSCGNNNYPPYARIIYVN